MNMSEIRMSPFWSSRLRTYFTLQQEQAKKIRHFINIFFNFFKIFILCKLILVSHLTISMHCYFATFSFRIQIRFRLKQHNFHCTCLEFKVLGRLLYMFILYTKFLFSYQQYCKVWGIFQFTNIYFQYSIMCLP